MYEVIVLMFLLWCSPCETGLYLPKMSRVRGWVTGRPGPESPVSTSATEHNSEEVISHSLHDLPLPAQRNVLNMLADKDLARINTVSKQTRNIVSDMKFPERVSTGEGKPSIFQQISTECGQAGVEAYMRATSNEYKQTEILEFYPDAIKSAAKLFESWNSLDTVPLDNPACVDALDQMCEWYIGLYQHSIDVPVDDGIVPPPSIERSDMRLVMRQHNH